MNNRHLSVNALLIGSFQASPISSQRVVSKRVPISYDSNANESGSSNGSPATFVCEGIEVDFDSSDSEDEVRALKVVKVLKKNTSTNGCAIQICSAEDNRKPKLIPWVHGKVLHKPELPKKAQSSDEGQVSKLRGKPPMPTLCL